MEKNEELFEEDKIDFQRGGSVTISTTVEPKLWRAAKHNKISWTKALELGLQLILSEIDPMIYAVPECDVKKKFISFKNMFEQAIEEKEALEKQLEEIQNQKGG